MVEKKSASDFTASRGLLPALAEGHGSDVAPDQQPDGDVTPGVAVAPVALAGAIMAGVARFIVMLSAQADVLGVGATVNVGSMLVLPSSVIAG
jgi:hypothetical protein